MDDAPGGCVILRFFCLGISMSRKFARVLVPLLLAALAAAGCAVQRPVQEPKNWYAVDGGNWQPGSELLAEIAGAIPAEAAHAPHSKPALPADAYTVQYQGQLQDGRRLVRLAGACETHGSTASQLKAAFFVIFDGGTCFFDATYDPALRRFTAFSFHGRA
jgi:hypothetical protein